MEEGHDNMGRIAEALKRAQQQRSHRLGQAADPSFPGGSTAGSLRVSGRGSSRAESYGEPSPSLLSPPPVPEPFPIVAPPILSQAVGAEVVALHDPRSALAEKYRSVRTRLITANPGGGPRVLAVTSCLRGEGKTVTTANLGFALSELKYLRVAMVDLDFHRRGLSFLLGAETQAGLAEILRGEMSLAEVCVPAVRDNLYLVPAGDPVGAPAGQLLAGKHVGAFFRELAERFHYTLIDTPPVDESADAVAVAPLCHAAIVVARACRTPEPLLHRCVRRLQANRVAVAGCILTGYDETRMHPGVETPDYYQGAS